MGEIMVFNPDMELVVGAQYRGLQLSVHDASAPLACVHCRANPTPVKGEGVAKLRAREELCANTKCTAAHRAAGNQVIWAAV